MGINCHFFVKIPSNHVCCFLLASEWVYGYMEGVPEEQSWGNWSPREPQEAPDCEMRADCDAHGLLSSYCWFEPPAHAPQLSTQFLQYFLVK